MELDAGNTAVSWGTVAAFRSIEVAGADLGTAYSRLLHEYWLGVLHIVAP